MTVLTMSQSSPPISIQRKSGGTGGPDPHRVVRRQGPGFPRVPRCSPCPTIIYLTHILCQSEESRETTEVGQRHFPQSPLRSPGPPPPATPAPVPPRFLPSITHSPEYDLVLCLSRRVLLLFGYDPGFIVNGGDRLVVIRSEDSVRRGV